MTVVQLSPLLVQHFDDSNGAPLSGGKLFTYAAGTTTKLATYTDSSGATPNTNPIILNSRGECNCWMASGVSYKFILSPSTDTDPPTNPIWTVDNIMSGGVPSASTPVIFRQAVSGSVYNLPSAPTSSYFVLFLDGVEQDPVDYSVTGTTLTLLGTLNPSEYTKLMATYI